MSDLGLLLRDAHMDSAVNDLADTDRWLVRKEVGAIELARRGRLEEAEAIIDAPDYQRAARTYFELLAQIERHAKIHIRQTEDRFELYLFATLIITCASFLLVAVAWVSLVRTARRWGCELELARNRVEESAAQLRQSHQELAAKNRELFRLARIDTLTGLPTRLQLAEDIGNPWADSRFAARFAFLCDIDSFRHYNELQGHLAGDRVLRAVARALEVTRNWNEQVYRVGGDQMLILSAAQSEHSATQRAHEFRAAVEQLRLPQDLAARKLVTISIGIAPVDERGDTHIERWLTRARAALRQAKRDGFNRVAADGSCPAAQISC